MKNINCSWKEVNEILKSNINFDCTESLAKEAVETVKNTKMFIGWMHSIFIIQNIFPNRKLAFLDFIAEN